MFSNFATLKFWVAAVLFAAALIMALKKVHPIIIILISAVIGIIIGYAGLLG
jgi:chromate transporter